MSPIQLGVREENGEHNLLNNLQLENRNRILLRLRKILPCVVYLGYSMILVCHFIGWVLFTLYAGHCSFTQRSTTQRCQDFDLFSYPRELEFTWQVITGINAIAYMVLTTKLHYADASSFALRKLLKIPKSSGLLLAELAIAVSYETMMIVYEKVPSAKAIEVGFVWRNVCVTSLVFFLNFTWPPRETKYKVQFFSTLMVFFLDQLVMACLMVCHVHFRITALEKSRIEAGDYLHVVVTMTTITGVWALHTSLLKFFWHKIFESKKNWLRKGVI